MTTPHNNENKLSQQGSLAEHTLPPPSDHRYRSPPTAFYFKTLQDELTWTRTPHQGISHDLARCPICESVFLKGYYHRADRKLYDHMGRGKGHRRERNEIEWTF
jgi:hypothetical protein